MLHAYMAKPEKMFYFIETSVALVLAFIHKKYQLNKYLCCFCERLNYICRLNVKLLQNKLTYTIFEYTA